MSEVREREEDKMNGWRFFSYLSMLMATKFNIDAVLKVTSKAIQKSQIVSLNSHVTLTFTGHFFHSFSSVQSSLVTTIGIKVIMSYSDPCVVIPIIEA